MQKTYPNSALIVGLILAPFPLLICLFFYGLIFEPSLSNNYESGSFLRFMSALLIFGYIFYVILIAPFLMLILYFLNKYQKICLFSLSLIAYVSSIILSVLGSYFKDSELPNTLFELKKHFIFNPIFIYTFSTALGLYLYLKWNTYKIQSKSET